MITSELHRPPSEVPSHSVANPLETLTMNQVHDQSRLLIAVQGFNESRSDEAKAELIDAVSDRIESMVRKRLRTENRVRRWDQTSDLAQLVRLRLWKALDQLRVTNPRALLAIAAQHIRWAILERCAKHNGPRGIATHHASVAQLTQAARTPPLDVAGPPDRNATYRDLHEAVESLPGDLKAVIDLIYYHGMSHREAAELLGKSEKTVQRRCSRTCRMLAEMLGENCDGFDRS